MSKNLLKNTKCYLVGNMQYIQDAVSWREKVTKQFSGMGIKCLNPTQDICTDGLTEIEIVPKVQALLEQGDYAQAQKIMRDVRNRDLSCVDKCDFIFALIDVKAKTCGSYEEISWGIRCRKPIFVTLQGGIKNISWWFLAMIDLKYVFGTLEESIGAVKGIDMGINPIDTKYWRLFREDLR